MWLPKWRRNAEKKGGKRCHLKLYWTELNWTRFLFWYSFKASFQRQFTVRRGVSIYSISIQDSKIFYLALFSPQSGIYIIYISPKFNKRKCRSHRQKHIFWKSQRTAFPDSVARYLDIVPSAIHRRLKHLLVCMCWSWWSESGFTWCLCVYYVECSDALAI